MHEVAKNDLGHNLASMRISVVGSITIRRMTKAITVVMGIAAACKDSTLYRKQLRREKIQGGSNNNSPRFASCDNCRLADSVRDPEI